MYIGGRIENELWQLPRSIWASKFKCKDGDYIKSHIQYEEYIRNNLELYDQLELLDGKTLGCWCQPNDPKCHGNVLIKMIEDKKIATIEKQLKDAGLSVKETDHLRKIRHAKRWLEHEHILAYATRLDNTNLYYFEPKTFFALNSLWGGGCDHWPVFTSNNQVYFVVGEFDGKQPIGPFWDENIPHSKAEAICNEDADETFNSSVGPIFDFARVLQPILTKNMAKFEDALQKAIDYHRLHRSVVRHVGNALKVDMADHDLTKTKIIQLALAYAHHWDEQYEKDKTLNTKAWAAIRSGHCCQENHHPEFELAGKGDVDVSKLLVDRLSVHLQKDPEDDQLGWDVNKKWIPTLYSKQWDELSQKFSHLDLYDVGLKPAVAENIWIKMMTI